MKIASINLNGVRAAFRRGLQDWVSLHDPDIIAVQETKAQIHTLEPQEYLLPNYQSAFSSAEKKGYSGVGLYAKKEPLRIIDSCGLDWADEEGRYIAFEYPNFMVISLYMPSGTSGDHRQKLKYEMLDYFYEHHLKAYLKFDKPVIICGDINIAHKAIDIKNAKANEKNSGFLPEEREWMDSVLELGYIDAFRHRCKDEDHYTWWTYRGRARENNVGWRIDYQLTTPDVKDLIKHVEIFKDPVYSDHAPLLIEYELTSE